MSTIQKNKIIWSAEDWLGGFDQTSATVYNKKGHVVAGAQRIDPFRAFGYIGPGFDPVDATNQSSVTGTILNGVVNGANAYCITADGKVQKLGTLSGTVVVSTTSPFPHTISDGHATYVGSDIVNYYANISSTSTLLAFFSFRDGTDWNVGIYNYGSDSFDDDFMSSVPASPLASPYLTGGKDAPHPMIVGDDDILYIGDRNFVHAFDGSTGADGTFYPAVLTLPQGWTITCFAKTNDFKLGIGAYYTSSQTGSTFNLGQAKVYTWDYLSLDPTYIYNLNDNYISELVNWRGTLAAFTQGRQGISEPNLNKVQVLNGAQFSVLTSYQSGSTPCRGGVDIINDDIIWNSGGKVYTYAKIPKTENYILNSPFGGPNNSSGMCKIFSSTLNVIFSSGTGTGVGLVFARVGTFASGATLNTDVAYPFTNERMKGRIESVTFKFMEATTDATGSQITIASIKDKATSATIINSVAVVGEQEIRYLNDDNSPLGDFTSLSFEVLWIPGIINTKCPLIESIIVEFSEITI